MDRCCCKSDPDRTYPMRSYRRKKAAGLLLDVLTRAMVRAMVRAKVRPDAEAMKEALSEIIRLLHRLGV